MKFWLDKYADGHGCLSPATGKVHIPVYVYKDQLYEQFKKDFLASKHNNEHLPSRTTFYDFLNDEYSHLQFLRYASQGRCSTCLNFTAELEK